MKKINRFEDQEVQKERIYFADEYKKRMKREKSKLYALNWYIQNVEDRKDLSVVNNFVEFRTN